MAALAMPDPPPLREIVVRGHDGEALGRVVWDAAGPRAEAWEPSQAARVEAVLEYVTRARPARRRASC